MKKILGSLIHPLVLTCVGVLALALVIWFWGPLIAFASWRPLDAEWVRAVLIGVIILSLIAWKGWTFLRAKRGHAQMADALGQADRGPPTVASESSEQVDVVRQRFQEALLKLKQSRLTTAGKQPAFRGRFAGQQYLYQLPWYVFIGAPGSGKTAALKNSGLHFPLADAAGDCEIKGVGGTRNCDWWFTDEAILLDTAGRYATQESNPEVDAAEWTGFLQLLKKHRPRRPINGILLTVSISDLLTQSSAERERHAHTLRTRINELHSMLNIRFPIYVLVTKCDLLAGFMEFFGELGKEDRAQVWGMTLPYLVVPEGPDPLVRFGAEFDALERRLNDRLTDRLQLERDPTRRVSLYGFPQQFAALKGVLGAFLSEVFTASRFHETAMLRGVYFTSGTQEGSPIDRVMGLLSRRFGLERRILPPAAASGRSYFLTRLLREVVFGEQGLAGANLKWERRLNLIKWAAYSLLALLTVGMTAAWFVSYQNNSSYVSAVDVKVAEAGKRVESLPVGGTIDVVGLLPVLQSVRELTIAGGVEEQHVPMSMGFGLFQGEKLNSASRNAYQRLLQESFLPRLVLRIEDQLRRGGNPELLYEGLKAYIMLHDPDHFDARVVKDWIVTDWSLNLPRDVPVEDRKALESHLDGLLASGAVSPPLPVNGSLIQSVRTQLAALPLPQRIYSRLKRQGVGANIPEFKISEVAGPSASLVFVRASREPLTKGMPGLYTYEGYHTAFLREAEKATRQLAEEEPWVLGTTDPAQSRLTDPGKLGGQIESVRRLYLEDYARNWEKFVADIRLRPADSLERSIEIARILSAPDSPLPPLLRGIVKETTLGEKPQESKTIVGKATDKVKEGSESLLKMFSGGEQAAPPVQAGKLENIVDARPEFERLRRLTKISAPGQPAPIDSTLVLISDLYTALTAIETAVKGGNAPPPSTVQDRIRADSARLPNPLGSMLQTLSTAGTSHTLEVVRSNISASLASSITDFCTMAIKDRYPFVRSSQRDVTQEDFDRLFAPGGLLDDFFQKNLQQYVDTSTRPWSFKRIGDTSMGDSSALAQFQRAAAIREVFFRGGARTAGIRLEFKPVEMDASITHVLLDVDSQVVQYNHGPQVRQALQWPGPRGSRQLRLQMEPPLAAGAASGKVFEGPWGLFRMFDQMQVDATDQSEKFKVTFNVDGRKAMFEVTTSSVQNPFRYRELEQFRCPGGL